MRSVHLDARLNYARNVI